MAGITKHGNISASFELVTPDQAARWLKLSKGNRKLNTKKMSGMVRDLTNMNFPVNGDTVRFDDSGVLIDGHHRLNAIARSGMPLTVLVVRGIPRAAVRTIDQDVTPRTKTYVLGGLRGEKNASELSAIIKLEHKHQSDNKSADLTSTETVKFLDDNPSLRDSAKFAAEKAKLSDLPIAPRIAGWLHYHLTQKFGERGADFMDDLYNPEARSNEPVLAELVTELDQLGAQNTRGWDGHGELAVRGQRELVLDAWARYANEYDTAA